MCVRKASRGVASSNASYIGRLPRRPAPKKKLLRSVLFISALHSNLNRYTVRSRASPCDHGTHLHITIFVVVVVVFFFCYYMYSSLFLLYHTDSCQSSPTALIATAAADDALTASSVYDDNVGPTRSRLFTAASSTECAGWATSSESLTTSQYIQVRRSQRQRETPCCCCCCCCCCYMYESKHFSFLPRAVHHITS